jgi:hypothetical protein
MSRIKTTIRTIWGWCKNNKIDTAILILLAFNIPISYGNPWFWSSAVMFVLSLFDKRLLRMYRLLTQEQDELYRECDKLRQGWRDLYYKARDNSHTR